jgi:GcrA cell cycle regulator
MPGFLVEILMTTMAWTDDRVERLKALFAEGKSATEIAGEFRVTRNAVCGKISRLGLFRKENDPKPPKSPVTRPRIRITPANTNSNGLRLSITHEPVSLAKLRVVDVKPLAVPFADLLPGDCRYPEGDPPTFCGHPKLENSSYCMAHHVLCTTPPQPRRR